MKLVFKDGSYLTLAGSSGIIDIWCQYVSMEAVGIDVAKCTSDNCSLIRIYDDEDVMVGEYPNMIFEGVSTSELEQDEVTIYEAHFHFRPKNEVELLTDRVAELEASQVLQDGAIDDIAEEVFG